MSWSIHADKIMISLKLKDVFTDSPTNIVLTSIVKF